MRFWLWLWFWLRFTFPAFFLIFPALFLLFALIFLAPNARVAAIQITRRDEMGKWGQGGSRPPDNQVHAWFWIGQIFSFCSRIVFWGWTRAWMAEHERHFVCLAFLAFQCLDVYRTRFWTSHA